MIWLSLLLNVVVLVPVCIGLLTHAEWTDESYGDNTPARRILLSIYLAFLIVSAALLVFNDPKFVMALLTVQVMYKLITPVVVGSLDNPVVVSNLAISCLHIATIAVIWKTTTQSFPA